MPFDARILQILIASPGDVKDERNLLSEVISEWNYVNARERRVVLLPLRWETHASPELGASPQAIINRQVVDSCDMAVGVFWTRLGTPTDVAESGTAEEISRVGSAGKPVMLYFSKAKAELDAVDLAEYARLKEFKKKAYPQGFIEDYESLTDFREKFTRQLAIKVLEIVARDAEEAPSDDLGSRAHLSLELLKSAPDSGRFGTLDYFDKPVDLWAGADIEENVTSVAAKRLTCTNRDEIPDFGEDALQEGAPDLRIGFKRRYNRDFFRQVVEYSCQPPVLGPFRLAVTASHEHGLRDIYLEIRVSGLRGDLLLQQPAAPSTPEPYTLIRDRDSYIAQAEAIIANSGQIYITGHDNTVHYFNAPQALNARLSIDKDEEAEWLMRMELPAVQAGRTVYSVNAFWIVAERECKPSFDATIYSSDTTPFASHVDLEIQMDESTARYQEIVGQFLEGHPLPG
jgi:hypothetical protein